MSDTMDVLNLYAGVGGNRKLWDGCNVTAIEYDPEIAGIYSDNFPQDEVVVADAHRFLELNYDSYDFIWASPPCPTHSNLRQNVNPDVDAVYPDMRLYQEIIFLKHNFTGDWVVENVNPYFEPLINGLLRGRHMFWSNFHIPEIEIQPENVKRQDGSYEELEERYGFDLSGYGLSRRRKRKLLNNCVEPELGKHVYDAATKNRQATVTQF